MRANSDVSSLIAEAVVDCLELRLRALEESLARLGAGLANPAPLLTRSQTGEWANCSVRTVDGWLAAGCPHVRIGGPGGSPRMVTAEVLAWLRQRSEPPASDSGAKRLGTTPERGEFATQP